MNNTSNGAIKFFPLNLTPQIGEISMYNILLVEDHRVLATGVERFLAGQLSSPVIDITASGKECLARLHEKNYDLVLLDIGLPDISGAELCRLICSSFQKIRIIALTGMIDYSAVSEMRKAGASGYILKTAIPDELIEGIESVMRGEIYISRDIMSSF